uniref:Ig-like domain-containing protein n=1 Tax=Latimeria chalumnae TaxID=7897 RepID=H3A4B3_LATCH
SATIYKEKRILAGNNISLSCHLPHVKNFVFIIWRIQTLEICYISKMADSKITSTCKDRISIPTTPKCEWSLQILSVEPRDEGHYTCETVAQEGTYTLNITVTVLVPPQVDLYGKNGVAVCTAYDSKPAANISWIPSGNYTTEETVNENGTVTVNSTYRAGPSPVENLTCIITHPAFVHYNKTISISLKG